MTCALLAVLGAAGCSSGAGGATASGGAPGRSSASSATGGTASGGVAGAASGGAAGIGGPGGGTTGTGGATGACQGTTNACTTVGTQCGSSTSLQTCSVAENGCTALATSTCSTGLVCERAPPADCVDPTWAEWPMPNDPTDVAAGAPNPEAYTDNGDGTITDNVTELMWQKAVPPTTYTTWPQAAAYCPTLTLAGHRDWRLPSRIELVSIVDVGRSNPSINGTYFPATPASYFWSSSLVWSLPPIAWYVNFDYGYSNYYGGVDDGTVVVFPVPVHVRCVR